MLVPAVPVARIGASQPERHRWTEQSPVARLAAGAQEKYSLDNSFLRSRRRGGRLECAPSQLILGVRPTPRWTSVVARGYREGWDAMRSFDIVIERDPDSGLFVGHVPGWPGAHSQGETVDELQENLREVVAMLLEDGEPQLESEFVGVQTISVG